MNNDENDDKLSFYFVTNFHTAAYCLPQNSSWEPGCR